MAYVQDSPGSTPDATLRVHHPGKMRILINEMRAMGSVCG